MILSRATFAERAQYMAAMSRDGAWVEDEIIVALARALGLRIHVFTISSGGVREITTHPYDGLGICVFYNCYDNDVEKLCHFDALIPLK